jgi:hypothetical protein
MPGDIARSYDTYIHLVLVCLSQVYCLMN